jgi:hypothetical protein
VGGGIGADGGERLIGLPVEPAELTRDPAGELLGADLPFDAAAPGAGEQRMEEQVALAGEAWGEDEDLAHQGGQAGVAEFDHGAIEFEVLGQGPSWWRSMRETMGRKR